MNGVGEEERGGKKKKGGRLKERRTRYLGIAYPLALFKHLIKFSSDLILAFRRKAKNERGSFSRNFDFEVRWDEH
jgi:hypothetical protein